MLTGLRTSLRRQVRTAWTFAVPLMLVAPILASALTAFVLHVGAAERATFAWPQFHGPRRDNKSGETALLKEWPPGGPKLVWITTGIGEGFSTVSIADGLIYTTGDVADDTVITALDMDGHIEWAAENGAAWEGEYPGARGTPTIDDGRLYHENGHGDVACLDAQAGKMVWSLNIIQKFNGHNIRWGLAESLLIDGDNVICTPGGDNAGIAALSKRTGETVWVCRETRDKPGYCSPIVFEYKGIRQIVTMMARSVVGVNAHTGGLLWQVEHVTPYDENIVTPVFYDGCVFITSQVTGSRLLRLHVKANEVAVEQVWASKLLENQHGGVVLVGDYVYGACRSRGLGPWACLDIRTGKRMYADPGIGPGALTYADGMFYALNHTRTVALVRPTPRAFEIVSQFQIPRGGRGPTWAHPVVCGGRLYIRHGDLLYCYDITREQ